MILAPLAPFILFIMMCRVCKTTPSFATRCWPRSWQYAVTLSSLPNGRVETAVKGTTIKGPMQPVPGSVMLNRTSVDRHFHSID